MDKHLYPFRIPFFSCDLSAPEVLECQYCEFKTFLRVTLDNHTVVVHEQKQAKKLYLRSYKCANCDFQTYSILVLTKHASSCSHQDMNHPKMLEKVDEIDQIPKKWFQCDHCLYRTHRTGNFKRHMLTYSDPTASKCRKCAMCPFKSINKACLRWHLATEHVDTKWFKCEQCSFKTRRLSGLKQHLFNRHAPAEDIKWLKCDQCPFVTKHKFSLKGHMQSKHQDSVEWLQCQHCSFKSKYKDSFKCHVVNRHGSPGEMRWFQCEQCVYKTKYKSNFKRHLQRHSLNKKQNRVKNTVQM